MTQAPSAKDALLNGTAIESQNLGFAAAGGWRDWRPSLSDLLGGREFAVRGPLHDPEIYLKNAEGE